MMRRGLQVLQIELELVGLVGRVERGRAAGGGDGQEGGRHIRTIRQHDRHPIAAADAGRGECRADAFGQRAQAGAAQPGAARCADGALAACRWQRYPKRSRSFRPSSRQSRLALLDRGGGNRSASLYGGADAGRHPDAIAGTWRCVLASIQARRSGAAPGGRRMTSWVAVWPDFMRLSTKMAEQAASRLAPLASQNTVTQPWLACR